MSIFDWSLTAASNGNADATINFQEGQAPSTVNDSARALMARMAFFRNWSAGNMTQGGASNAYTITSGESLTAYTNGMRFLWKPNGDSSGAVTLNVDAIGAKKVYLPSGTQAGSGNIDADAVYDVVYQSALDSANGGFKIVGAPDISGYTPGGTDVALADGGTGASLADPNADRILFWDDSAGAVTWLTASTGLTISGTSITVDSTVWTSANDGAGSGLDADTLDGVQGSAFAQLSGATFIGNVLISKDTPVLDLYRPSTGDPVIQLRTNSRFDRISNLSTGLGIDINYSGTVESFLFTTTGFQGRIAAGATTTGTLTATSANRTIQATGNITINNSVFAAGDIILIYAGASARTLTQGSGVTMRLDGTSTTGSRTLAARGVAMLFFVSASEVIVAGGAVT